MHKYTCYQLWSIISDNRTPWIEVSASRDPIDESSRLQDRRLISPKPATTRLLQHLDSIDDGLQHMLDAAAICGMDVPADSTTGPLVATSSDGVKLQGRAPRRASKWISCRNGHIVDGNNANLSYCRTSTWPSRRPPIWQGVLLCVSRASVYRVRTMVPMEDTSCDFSPWPLKVWLVEEENSFVCVVMIIPHKVAEHAFNEDLDRFLPWGSNRAMMYIHNPISYWGSAVTVGSSCSSCFF
jgi:hypothetical protein